jgi:multidrug efflux system membrane fusion protein
MFRVLMIGLLAVAGASGYMWYMAPPPPQTIAPPPPAIAVSAVPAAKRDIPVLLSGIGAVQALNTVQLRSRVDGTLDQVNFQEGQLVKKDDLLAKIDPRLFQAALDQAKAKKAQDQAQLVTDLKDLDRSKQLATQQFASQQIVDQLTAKVGVDQALIDADEAAIRTAETNLGYTSITAPFSGRMGLRNVDAGNIVKANDLTTFIATLTQIRPIAVVFTLPEGELPSVRAAQRAGDVRVIAYDQDGKQALATGKLLVIDNQVNQGSGTIRLKALFDNNDDALWPGQYTPVRVEVNVKRNAVTFPTAALQRGPNGLFVWVARPDNKAVMAPIEAGPSFETVTVAEKGLSEGDQIIVSNQYRLLPNARIKVDTRPVAANEAGGRS